MNNRWSVLMLYMIWTCPVFGQLDELQFRSYTNEQGLSQNSVYAITQSQEGFIWAGTINGLNRFDGKQFKTFYPNLPDSSIHSSVIYSLYIDQDNRFYVGTAEQLFLFDPSSYQFSLAKDSLIGLQLPEKVSVSQILDDGAGRLWMSTLAHGVYCYDKTSKKTYAHIQSELLRKSVTGMTRMDNGNIVISTTSNLFQSNRADLVMMSVDFSKIKEPLNIRSVAMLGNEMVLGLSEVGLVKCQKQTNQNYAASVDQAISEIKDINFLQSESDSVLWVGSRSQGILKYHLPKNEWTTADMNTRDFGLKSNFILTIFQDQQNRTWIGMSGGGMAVNTSDENIFDLVRPAEISNNLNGDNMVFGMLEFDASNILMGSLNDGLKIYHPKTRKLEYFFDENLPTQASNIYNFSKDGDEVWMATWAGLCSFNVKEKRFRFWGSKTKDVSRLYAIHALDENRLLVGGENGLCIFNKRTKAYEKLLDKEDFLEKQVLITRYIQKLDEDHLLLATTDRGVVRYNCQTGIFQTFPHLEKRSNACRHFTIGTQDIFLATENGVLQVNKNDFSLQNHWTTANGLSNNFCYAIEQSDNDDLWVSSNLGLSRINLSKKSIKNFGLTDGLQDLEFNTAAVLKTNNRKLIFGGINGFNVFDPIQIPKAEPPQKPQLVEMKVMNEPYESKKDFAVLKKLELPYDKNFISLEFASLSEIKKDAVSYQYQLEGVDESWVDNGQRNFVNYTNLDAGDYQFNFRASFGDEIYSPINDQLKIVIHPAFWNTWWFKTLTVGILLGIVYFFYKNKMNRLEEKLEMEGKVERLENKALRLQMNPHFLFNTLNSIKHYAVFKNKEETSEFISDFSILMRKILENSKHNFIPLSEEIELIGLYVSIEQKRLKDSFEYTLSHDENFSFFEKQIPPMLIQPFVENAIWHGLMHKEGEKKINIHLASVENGYDCVIIDNGIGRTAHAEIKKKRNKKSLATEIAKDRLDLLTQGSEQNNDIEIIDLYEENISTGTKVILRIRD